MANFQREAPTHGTLTVEVDPDGAHVRLVYRATPESVRVAGLGADEHGTREIAVLEVASSTLTIYPINTLYGNERFLEPKYEQIVSIVSRVDFDVAEDSDEDLDVDLERLFGSLPRGLLRDYRYGLGLPKEYKTILHVIEESTDCVNLVLTEGRSGGVDGDTFTLSTDDFEELRAELDRISNRASTASKRVKKAHTHNELADFMGVGRLEVSRGRNAVTRLITDAASGIVTLAPDEQQALVEAAVIQSAKAAESRPETLVKLRDDIELVSLEILISKFEAALTTAHREAYWQKFFADNPFALNLVFGFSVIQIQGQASVGGRKLSGTGEKITDFLVKHSITNNVGLFEIKTPQSALLKAEPYRFGIYPASAELSGSISQVLDQRYQLQKSLVAKKDAMRDSTLEQYAIGCCLIIGRLPSGDDELKSFELLRAELKGVVVVTYDELLGKLQQLAGFLRPGDDEATDQQAQELETTPDGPVEQQ